MEEDDLEKEMKEITRVAKKEKDVSKTELFNQSEAEINASIKLILKRPTMLRILKYLINHEILGVKEITTGINSAGGPKVTYQCINNNLKKLAKAGILNYAKSNIDVRYSCYSLNESFPIKRVLERINPDDLLKKGYCNIWDGLKAEEEFEIPVIEDAEVIEIPVIEE